MANEIQIRSAEAHRSLVTDKLADPATPFAEVYQSSFADLATETPRS